MGVKQLMIEFVSNNFEIIVTAIVSLATGGGLISFAKFGSIKKQAEADAAVKWQDVYERLIDKLEKTNDKLSDDNKELRKKLEGLKDQVHKISLDVAGMQRDKCTRRGCSERITE